MNIQKFTQKSLEAIQNSQNIAITNQSSQVELIHVLYALLIQDDSLIKELLKKMNVSDEFIPFLRDKISAMPKVVGTAREADKVYISQNVDIALNAAEDIAKKMKDEFVSVEHIMLAIFDNEDSVVKEILKKYNVTKPEFLKVLSLVRGNTRVTTDTPEQTYDALKKYGQDLVMLARNQKLDPVIGRDDEIRNVIRILSRKTKNNPCLIGEPGVGKTAIAEGLALRIVRGDVPEDLKIVLYFHLIWDHLLQVQNIGENLKKD